MKKECVQIRRKGEKKTESRERAMVGFQQQRRLREEQEKANGNAGSTASAVAVSAVLQQQQQSQQQHGSSGNNRANSPRARLAMLKRSSTKCKAVSSNDPFRFQGNGVDFKGKLIGVRDVDEARGDAMCAEAMRLAKAAVKSAGHHKQRIILTISIEGLKIKDEKTQTVLHNFPVSRISFIARDTTDARAFGFIYGCTDNKYKFYGIKTAQTADRAVLSIRDMFQIVFEMKKAHLAEVKQKQEEQQKRESETAGGVRIDDGVVVADLLDLESELHNIEQGYNQLQNIPSFLEDSWPTNDLFASVQPSAPLYPTSTGTVAPLPPPPVSSFAQKNPADPFDDGFNPRSFPTVPPPAVPPSNLFNIQQSPLIPVQPVTAVWPSSDTFGLAANQAITFSDTNPFVSSVRDDTLSRMESDPFNTQQALKILQGSPAYNFNSAISWPTNENTVPPASNNPRMHTQWTEKKVSTLEEAFNKLVDMDTLVSGPESKKNPFTELVVPPKKVAISSVSTNATSTATMVMVDPPRAPCIPARTSAPLVVSTTANNDPFNDEFFN
ncbi:unnamed protein product [Thelazia callipaeda]|uniref:PID domain-containing protein n=1 Tax=Thelazia callipaeda TaxID=103827 RepID=A0A0N5CKW7_THECL|nr:unnamed protein product [Thelazia callipaeda]